MEESNGTVKWYDPAKAYGFVHSEQLGDLFVHKNSIASGRDELIKGQEVTFQTRKSPRGMEAYEVRVTRESALPSRPRGERSDTRRPAGPGFRNATSSTNRSGAKMPARLPDGPVVATVVSRDKDDRFLFLRSDEDDYDIFVHGSIFQDFAWQLQRGDKVRVMVETSPKGVRATSMSLT